MTHEVWHGWTIAAIVWLPGALAGCFSLDADCRDGVNVPAPRIGWEASYRGEGRLGMFLPHFILLHESADTPWPSNTIRLDDNLTFVAASARAEESRLGVDGARRPAIPVDYSVVHSQAGRIGPIAVSWVDPANGTLVQTQTPSYYWHDGKPTHQARFTKTDRPAFFGAGAIWGQELTRETRWNVSLRVEVSARAPEAVDEVHEGFMALQVHRVLQSEAGCIAIVDVSHQVIGKPVVTRMTFQEGLPVPTRIHEWSERWPDEVHTHLELVDFNDGDKARFPTFNQQRLPAGGLPTLPGVFTDSGLVFNTSFQEARDAALSTSGPDQWFAQNGDARLSAVVHQLGGQGTEIRDRWQLEWSTPSGDALRARIVNRTSSLPEPARDLDGGLIVEWDFDTRVAYPPVLTETVSVVALDELVQDVYGERLEVIRCTIASSRCMVGSHAVQEYPRYPGGGGTALPLPGMVVWIQTGLLMQEENRGWNANL